MFRRAKRYMYMYHPLLATSWIQEWALELGFEENRAVKFAKLSP